MIDPDDDTVYSVDASQCDDKVWLVKIPNYLSNEWRNVPNNSVVAKIVISDENGQSDPNSYKLVCNPEFIKDKDIPLNNKFVIQGINDNNKNDNSSKNLSIGARDGKTYVLQSSDIEGGYNSHKKSKIKKKSMVGCVSVRCNVMPPDDTEYFALKSKQIKIYNTPLRKTKLLQDNGPEFNLRSLTTNKKKNQNTRDTMRPVKMERSKLMDVICTHFEKHQFYNIKDLVDLTGQTPGYVKEILKEVAQLSKVPSRRHMWELKPEYRHYS